MAGELDPVEPDDGSGESATGSPPDAFAPKLATGDQAGLIKLITHAQQDPPVGLVIVGWDRQGTNSQPPSPHGPDRVRQLAYDAEVEQSVAFAVAACSGPTALVLAAADAEIAIVRPALSGPATAEALAHRIARQLDIELDRLAIMADQPAVRWAIGVAVGRDGDRATDLVRYAGTALNDAWLLGGRRLVAFDDGNRELLERPAQAD